jgi:ADP-dependent phosphofructokinase/glucokinase
MNIIFVKYYYYYYLLNHHHRITEYSNGRTCSAQGTEENSNRILFAKPNRMRLLARVDVKIILDRISEKQDMAVWTTFLQRGAGCDM